MDIDVEGDADADVVPLVQVGGAGVARRLGISEVLLLPLVKVRALCVDVSSVGNEFAPWVGGAALLEAVCGRFRVDGIAVRLICVMSEVR